MLQISADRAAQSHITAEEFCQLLDLDLLALKHLLLLPHQLLQLPHPQLDLQVSPDYVGIQQRAVAA